MQERILRAMHEPPEATRAWIRAEIIKRYPECIQSVSNDGGIIEFDQCIIVLKDWLCGKKDTQHIFVDNPPFEILLTRLQEFDSSRIEVRAKL